jgi:hypothetical protein
MASSPVHQNTSESGQLQDDQLAHPLFSTPELIAHIVDSLEGHDRKALFALALVSHAFSEPALDALWHKLRTFKHLIHLLPDDARGRKEVEMYMTCQDDDGRYVETNTVRALIIQLGDEVRAGLPSRYRFSRGH